MVGTPRPGTGSGSKLNKTRICPDSTQGRRAPAATPDPNPSSVNRRPFRAPHHSASMAALVGGGLKVRPGEASLAHNGVLFLDELPEYSAQALDSLRQPLETGEIVVARANAHVRYPARFQLIAAMNPCRCGLGGGGKGACGKAPRCQRDYQNRISGPMFDRIDLTVETPPVTAADMALPPPAEGTAEDFDDDPVPPGQASGQGESRSEKEAVGQDEQPGGLEHGHEGTSGGAAHDSEHRSEGKAGGDDAEPREGQAESTR